MKMSGIIWLIILVKVQSDDRMPTISEFANYIRAGRQGADIVTEALDELVKDGLMCGPGGNTGKYWLSQEGWNIHDRREII